MKKILITFTLIAAVLFTSCEEDAVIYNGTAVGLNQRNAQVSVPTTGTSETFPVTITSPSAEARTFSLEFVGDAPAAGGVSLGSITVPADSYDGTATVNFDFDAINLGDGETDTFTIRAKSDNTDIFGTELEIEYFKAVVCNDATLTIITDFWAEETGFSIVDSSGNEVFGFPQGTLLQGEQVFTADIFLADGCYTATMTDQFNDGQVSDGNFGSTVATGSWSIDCSILTFAAGGGAFVGDDVVNFCVGQ